MRAGSRRCARLDVAPVEPAGGAEHVRRSRGEIAEVAGALGRARVVTLTGVGGVGKTRWRSALPADAVGRYRDGVWLVELAPLADAAGLVEVVARALRVPTARAGRLR